MGFPQRVFSKDSLLHFQAYFFLFSLSENMFFPTNTIFILRSSQIYFFLFLLLEHIIHLIFFYLQSVCGTAKENEKSKNNKIKFMLN